MRISIILGDVVCDTRESTGLSMFVPSFGERHVQAARPRTAFDASLARHHVRHIAKSKTDHEEQPDSYRGTWSE